MNRIDRLVGILTTLQARRFTAAEFIADKYQISTRTVYRDIKALGEIGVPISFEQHKGYFIIQGYFLPPVSLTIQEANALILIASLSEKFSDPSTKRTVNSALEKIKAVLKHSDKEKVDQLHSNIKIYQPPESIENPDYLSTIQDAIINHKILAITYTNNHKEISKREIEPIGLTFYSNQWHMIAWCWKRMAYRDFKVLSIEKLTPTNDGFRKKEHWDINEYIQSLQ